ncbi:MAG: SurA N-terminal domain-containing protein [Rickettsiales bacterium]
MKIHVARFSLLSSKGFAGITLNLKGSRARRVPPAPTLLEIPVMLMAMRRSANNIFVKFLLLSVAVVFSFWGMASWVISGASERYVASVGGKKILYSEFDDKVRNYVRRLEVVTGKAVAENSPEYDGIRRNVLRSMVQNALLDRRSADLGIRVGDEALLSEIANQPSFANASGRFDAAKFNEYLQGTGLSKREFFDDLRKGMRVEFLRRLFGYAPPMPGNVLRDLANYRYEGRTADVLPIPLSLVEATGEPSETDLVELYKENSATFFTPEYRDVTYVTLTPELLKKEIDVDAAALRPFYDQHVDDYYVEEKRRLIQYRFDAQEEAEAAYKDLSAQKTPESGDRYASSRSDAGAFTKEELLAAFRDPVFSADEKSYVPPIRSPFGWHVFYVQAVEKEHLGTFEEVKPRLEKDYVQNKMEIRYPEFIGAAEDKLAEGASVEELAASVGATAESVVINAAGKDKNDVASPFLEGKADLLVRIFSADARGVPSPIVPAEDGSSYTAFEVKKVTPERTKSLDEVRGRVVGLWKDIKRRSALRRIVEQTLAENRDDAAATIKALAARFSLEPDKNVEVRRPSENRLPQVKDYMNAESAEKLFYVAPGGLAVGDNLDKRLTLVMHSLAVRPAAEVAGKSRIASDKEAWTQSFSEDFLAQYFRYLEKIYGVKYNEEFM